MNPSPHPEQPLSLVSGLLDDFPQVTCADAYRPFETSLAGLQHDLGFGAVPEDVHMRRFVIVNEHHEPKPVSAMDDHHENNPSRLGFKRAT
jgi:hypothetical protein